MKRAISILATTATLTIGTAATAAEHLILILPDAYFPAMTYMDPGDTVRFVNASGSAHHMMADDSSWEIGPLEPDAEHTMVIDASVHKSFVDVNVTDAEGNYTVVGEVSFAAAPLD